jgi:hypothetical protein
VTEQLAVLPLPLSVQTALLKVPGPLLVQVTVPLGVTKWPMRSSRTVAVQVMGTSTTAVLGQFMLVLVGCPVGSA